MLAEQSQVPDYEQPKLLSIDINDKMDALKREINYLISKAKYFKPKPKKKPVSETKETSNKTKTEEGEKDKEEKDNKNEEDKEKSKEYDEFDSMFGEKTEEETTTKAPKRKQKTEDSTAGNDEKLELGDGKGQFRYFLN